MLYDKETLILEKVTSTLLFNEIRKRPNQRADMIGFGGHGKERKRRRKSPSSSKACHFCHRKVIKRMTASIGKSH